MAGDDSWEVEARGLAAELAKVQDRYMGLLRDRTRDERATRTAAVREAWRLVLHGFDAVVRRRVAHDVRALCGRVDYLPVQGRAEGGESLAQLVPALKRQASLVEGTLSRAMEEEAGQRRHLLDEVERLRSYVFSRGRRLHTSATDADRAGDYCACAGCELVRGMYDVPVPLNDTESIPPEEDAHV